MGRRWKQALGPSRPSIKKTNTTSLPQTLRKELKASRDATTTPNDAIHKFPRSSTYAGRKARRKAAKDARKQAVLEAGVSWSRRRKAESGIHNSSLRAPNGPVGASTEDIRGSPNDIRASPRDSGGDDTGNRRGARKRHDGPAHRPVPPRSNKRARETGKSKPESQDDKTIRRLEKLLGISNKVGGQDVVKNDMYTNALGLDDDLADLVNFCNRSSNAQGTYELAQENQGSSSADESDGEEDAESFEGMASRRKRATLPDSDSSDQGPSSATGSGESSVDISSESSVDSRSASGATNPQRHTPSHPSPEKDREDAILHPEISPPDCEDSLSGDGCKPVSAAYVPPSKRGRAIPSDLITRRMRGHLNRVTESNAFGVAKDLASLLENAPSGLSRRTLCESFAHSSLDALRDGAEPGRNNPYVQSHMAIVSYLGGVFDAMLVATFIVGLVTRMDALLPAGDSANGELRGYTSCFASMYLLRVVAAESVHDMIRRLSSTLSPGNVELLLVLLRSVGPKLRKDDPVSLRDIILHIKQKTEGEGLGSTTERAGSSRVSIMLDLIYEIKDNKVRNTEAEGVAKQHEWACANCPTFSAKMDDLLNPKFAAMRWWEMDEADRSEVCNSEVIPGLPSYNDRRHTRVRGEADLMVEDSVDELAVKHRMNTALRRAVFKAILGSADVDDACSRLERMAAFDKTDASDREVARTLVYCCSAEKSFNEFYALLARRICQRSRASRFAVEFALVDAANAVCSEGPSSASKRKARNYGSMFGMLLGSRSLRLVALQGGPDIDAESDTAKEFHRAAFERLFAFPESEVRAAFRGLALDETKKPDTALSDSIFRYVRREVIPNRETSERRRLDSLMKTSCAGLSEG